LEVPTFSLLAGKKPIPNNGNHLVIITIFSCINQKMFFFAKQIIFYSDYLIYAVFNICQNKLFTIKVHQMKKLSAKDCFNHYTKKYINFFISIYFDYFSQCTLAQKAAHSQPLGNWKAWQPGAIIERATQSKPSQSDRIHSDPNPQLPR